MSTTTTEQPKRNLEDFKKLGAALHQRLLLARTAPLLLKLQPQPEPLPAKEEPAEEPDFEKMFPLRLPEQSDEEEDEEAEVKRLHRMLDEQETRKPAVSAAGASFFTKRAK